VGLPCFPLDGTSTISLKNQCIAYLFTTHVLHETVIRHFLSDSTDASALVDCDQVFGIDCDDGALEQARRNVRSMELEHCISLVQAKVEMNSKSSSNALSSKGPRNSGVRGRSKPNHPRKGKETIVLNCVAEDADAVTNSDSRKPFPFPDHCVDTVMTNPPFGTKADMAGIDVQFLLLSCRLARRAVYSFHKTTTRAYILRTVQRAFPNAIVSVVAEMKFDIRQTYMFHQKASVDVAVDLIRVELVRPAHSDFSEGHDYG
jgi:predicted RNA methylase